MESQAQGGTTCNRTCFCGKPVGEAAGREDWEGFAVGFCSVVCRESFGAGGKDGEEARAALRFWRREMGLEGMQGPGGAKGQEGRAAGGPGEGTGSGPAGDGGNRLVVRAAVAEDLAFIHELYNRHVRETVVTFDTEEKTWAFRETWWQGRPAMHPVVVAWGGPAGGERLGYGSLGPWAVHGGYRPAAEISVYVEAGARGQGVGRRLVEELLTRGAAAGVRAVVARVVPENRASLRLCLATGFLPSGYQREVGQKFGRRLDVCLLERLLEPANRPPEL